MADGTCTVADCPNGVHCKGFCQPHYMRFWRYGDPLRGGPLKERVRATEENFWARVDKDGPLIVARSDLGPCWLWTGKLDIGGYGIFGSRGRVRVRVHRESWERVNGRPIPDDREIDHLCHSYDLSCPGGRCEHRRCMNPDHLEPVTHRENSVRGVPGRMTMCSEGHELVVVGMRNGNPRRGCPTCRTARRHELRDTCLSIQPERRKSIVVTSALLTELVAVYTSAAEGGSPRLAVARHFGRSPATASDWIAKARAEGFLAPATRG